MQRIKGFTMSPCRHVEHAPARYLSVTQGLARSKKKDQNIHNSRAVDPDPDPAAF